MMRTRTEAAIAAAPALALAVALAGCGKTDECTRLEAMVKQHETVLLNAKGRANAKTLAKKRADAAEAAMNTTLGESGIEASEAEIDAELTRRVRTIPTATAAQSPVQLGTTEDGGNITSTQWTVKLQEKDQAKAWDKVVVLATVPPLLTLTTVARDKGADGWTIVLQRLLPVRAPFQPAPVPLPALDDPGTVPSQMGFCGASELRKKIETTRAEIAKLKQDAEDATVLIASGPTFEGVRRRTQVASKNERDARAIMTQVMDAIAREKLPFKAIGFEEPSVIVELWGGPKELRALETILLPFGDRVKPTELAQPGVVRRAIVVVQAKKGSGEDEHGAH